MNKQELIAAVAEDTGMSKVAAERAVNSVFENITAQLGVGETVALLGFGTFGASHRKARKGVNPRAVLGPPASGVVRCGCHAGRGARSRVVA